MGCRVASGFKAVGSLEDTAPGNDRNSPPICPILKVGIIYKSPLSKDVIQLQYLLALVMPE